MPGRVSRQPATVFCSPLDHDGRIGDVDLTRMILIDASRNLVQPIKSCDFSIKQRFHRLFISGCGAPDDPAAVVGNQHQAAGRWVSGKIDGLDLMDPVGLLDVVEHPHGSTQIATIPGITRARWSTVSGVDDRDDVNISTDPAAGGEEEDGEEEQGGGGGGTWFHAKPIFV